MLESQQMAAGTNMTAASTGSNNNGGGGGGGSNASYKSYSTSSSSTGTSGVSVSTSSRKTSFSMPVDSLQQQELPKLLAELARGEFGAMITDDQNPMCLRAKRHKEQIVGLSCELQTWRIRERMKTASVALVLCLNIGVDPPDVVKIQPCARLECWVDPSSMSAPKAMEQIGQTLQLQYERWQPRARYKKCHDPTVDDVKKLCTSLRRNAKGERILFHYNGHGVPKPTANGEIWVFNKTFTQYIPLSIFELHGWMATPSIYVYDCSNAGIIINSFLQYFEQHEREAEQNKQQLPPSMNPRNCIHLAACSANEILPMNSELPADLFTSCLTTPIHIALKWYTMQNKLRLVPQINSDLIDKIPGKINDRRTMMGELNWIFTAITDTIAWNTLPRDEFQRLFRQDLLVASLFRNFLLAERILRSHDCIPMSYPALPPCYGHPMWKAWDYVVDLALHQLPDILEKDAPYRQLPFFEAQLTAFQRWLDRESESRSPPEQLPIVLQVLLSQVHRLRALELLARFLDLGPWAVNLALGVGIFPYVLKLLQSSAKELRPVLVFIWAKILAVDPSCQLDLVKDHKYFLLVLQDPTVSKEYRTLSAFVLACIVNNFLLGQTSALQGSLVSICLELVNDPSWLLRQWVVICLGMLWQNFEKARWSGVRDLAHEKLYQLLKDPIPEVRAAAVFALGTFISSVTDRSEDHANNIDRIIAITLLETVGEDMSPLVRLELVAALQWMVLLFESQFVTVCMQEDLNTFSVTASASGERSASVTHGMPGAPSPVMYQHHHSTHSLERHVTMRRGVSSSSISNMTSSMKAGTSMTNAAATIPFHSIYLKIWQGIYRLAHDPFPKVAETAQKIISYVCDAAVAMITAKEVTATEKNINLSFSLPPSPNTRVSGFVSLGTSGHDASGSSPPVGIVVGGGQQTSAISNWANKLRFVGNVGASSGLEDPQTLLQRKLRSVSINDETDSGQNAAHHSTTSGVGSGGSGSGGGEGSARSSTSENYDPKLQTLKSIVTTQFIPWAISYFTRPGEHRYLTDEFHQSEQVFPLDRTSNEIVCRKFLYIRNRRVRHQSREQQARMARIDTQTWLGKTQFTPSIVKLLPYEPLIAFAYREKVLIHDWSKSSSRSCTTLAVSAASLASGNNSLTRKAGLSSSPPAHAQFGNGGKGALSVERVSSIEFLNAHVNPLALVGHDDGVVRIWQLDSNNEICSGNGNSAGSPRVLTAFEAIPVRGWTTFPSSLVGSGGSSISSGSKHRSRDFIGTGIVTAWQQCSQQLIVGGGTCRFLRIWDVKQELKISDFPIGDETSLRVLAAFPNDVMSDLIVAGCSDGSVRLFDKRCSPSESRIRVYREHKSAILAATYKDNQTTLVTGCSQGKICIFDIRSRAPTGMLHQWDAGYDVTAIAVHQSADVIACGSANKITLYNQKKGTHNTLRSNEGFMGTKIGHPTTLSFHPYKLSLAVGFIDNHVAVYDPASEFYKLCDRWQSDVDDNPETFENVRRFMERPEMLDAIAFIQSKVQLLQNNSNINDDNNNNNKSINHKDTENLIKITEKESRLIYTICAFETAWYRRYPPSIWCHFLNKDTVKVFEFAEDLEYYWNDGYGYELTHKIACPAIVDMFENLDPNSKKPNSTFYFTHSGTLLKLLAHLGLYKDAAPLTYADYNKSRLWRTSVIDAFASNLAFILYECEEQNEPMILTLHQERPVRIPGCPKDSDLCSLSTMRQIFSHSLENCNFDEICEKPKHKKKNN